MKSALDMFFQNGKQVRILQPDIKRLRTQRGMSLQAVAEKTAMTRAAVHKIEKGERGMRGTTWDAAMNFMAALDATFRQLYPDAPFAPYLWTKGEVAEAVHSSPMSMAEIARRVGMSPHTANNIVNGAQNLTIEHMLVFTELMKPEEACQDIRLVGPEGHKQIQRIPLPRPLTEVLAGAPEEEPAMTPAVEAPQAPPVPIMAPEPPRPVKAASVPVKEVLTDDSGRQRLGDDVVAEVPVPHHMAGVKDVWGMYVHSPDMQPRYFVGEVVIVNPHRPPREGDYVVIETKGGAIHIRRLRTYKGDAVELEKHNPPGGYSVESDKIKRMWRIEAVVPE